MEINEHQWKATKINDNQWTSMNINENQRKSLEVFSDGCIKRSDKLKIVDSFEFQRDMHLEMDKFVGNGGSSAYGYLISKLNW